MGRAGGGSASPISLLLLLPVPACHCGMGGREALLLLGLFATTWCLLPLEFTFLWLLVRWVSIQRPYFPACLLLPIAAFCLLPLGGSCRWAVC